MEDTGLVVQNITKEFGNIVALDGVNLTIPAGRIVGLLGPNGAGKSTLVRLLSGVMEPTSGNAKLKGFDLSEEINRVKALTGLLPEEYALYEKLSVYEYIEFLATLYDMNKQEVDENFTKLAKKLDVTHFQNRLIETLSKGQKQKVALIAAIIHDPEILFLDEPLANLDVAAQRVVRQMIRQYKDENRIIIIATHLLENVKAICDDVVIIQKGKIKFNDSLKNFRQDYDDLEQAYLKLVGMQQ